MKLLLIRGKILHTVKIQLMNFTVFFQTKFGLHEFYPCIVYMNLFVYGIRNRDIDPLGISIFQEQDLAISAGDFTL